MSIQIDPSIFRTYDIRGIFNDTLTADVTRLIGQAIGSEALAQGEKTLIVGRDGRISGPVLVKALIEGILASGCHVIDIGSVPTPLLYFAINILECHSGVMLTGSHNPPDYNGIKTVFHHHSVAGDEITDFYKRIVENRLTKGHGKLRTENVVDRYLDRVIHGVKLEKPLQIVIDCGNGIGGSIAPALFRALGCDVTELFCEVDGRFPNHQADPAEPKNLADLIERVKEIKADVGLAFDGDADRLGVITNKGNLIYPDRLMMLLSEDLLSRNPGATIIFDVKCSRLLKELIEKEGGKPMMCKSGHSLVKTLMKETGALLAGELSGHLYFQERWYGFDDALYAGARFLEIVSKKNMDVETIFQNYPNSINTPELRLTVEESKKFELMEQIQERAQFGKADISTIDGLRVDFKNGWGLVRPSNTTPYLILRFEADTQAHLEEIESIFRRELLKIDPTLKMPF